MKRCTKRAGDVCKCIKAMSIQTIPVLALAHVTALVPTPGLNWSELLMRIEYTVPNTVQYRVAVVS